MNTPILCIPRSAFTEFSGIYKPDEINNIGKFLTAHPDEPNLATFIPRDEAETSADWIQVIPYCLFVCGADIFIYSRNKKGGEARLHEKLSIGVGGHIEQQDHEEPLMAYLNGTVREIQEEVGLDIPVQAVGGTVLGLLHDPDSEVGRVHLGVLHAFHISIEQMAVILKHSEESMSDPRFTSISDLVSTEEGSEWHKLENWSQWAVSHLYALINKPKPWEDEEATHRLRLLNLAACGLAKATAELLLSPGGREWMVRAENVEDAIAAVNVTTKRLIEVALRDSHIQAAENHISQQFVSTQPS